jgi:hypothetical protein
MRRALGLALAVAGLARAGPAGAQTACRWLSAERDMTKPFLPALSIAAALCGAAHAQSPAQVDAKTIDDWRTVDLGSGVSIDVPKAVGDAYKPTDKADAGLMLFRIGAKDAGDMYCGLDRLAYNAPPLGMNRNRALDFLTNAAPGVFCHGVGTGVRENFAEAAASKQGYSGSLRRQLQRRAGRHERGGRDPRPGGGGARRRLCPHLHRARPRPGPRRDRLGDHLAQPHRPRRGQPEAALTPVRSQQPLRLLNPRRVPI